jgi:hypothetical protein
MPPKKINMIISNGNLSPSQIINITNNNKNLNNTMQKNTSSSIFKGSMITNVHNARVGCGSCGK